MVTEGADGRKIVQSGNLRQLIDRLVDPKEFDLDYLRAFLMTHTMFMDSMQLLDAVIDEYLKFPPGTVEIDSQVVVLRYQDDLKTIESQIL